MLVVRDVFRCKPGKANALIEKFNQVRGIMEREGGFRNLRIMVDLVSTYWTVVLEGEVSDLGGFEEHMRTFGSTPEVREAMTGYMDLVEGGHREIYRLI